MGIVDEWKTQGGLEEIASLSRCIATHHQQSASLWLMSLRLHSHICNVMIKLEPQAMVLTEVVAHSLTAPVRPFNSKK
jgi:hypothetical protein